MSEDALAHTNFQYGLDAPKPADFNPEDWTVVKRSGDHVAATHRTGVTRKLPKHWLLQEPANNS